MSTNLDRLLESIDPDWTLDETSVRADDAINSFAVEASRMHRWEEFESFMARFYRHALTIILRVGGRPNLALDVCWSQCARLLRQAYGRSGEKAAFEIARTGAEGGLYRVLESVAQELAEELAGNEISARVSRYWDALSVDEKFATTDEYLAKYGHLLPSELTEGSAARIRANFPKVLEEHARLIQRMRRLGR